MLKADKLPKSKIFLFLLTAFVAGVGVRSFFTVPEEMVFVWMAASAVVIAAGSLRRDKKVIVFGAVSLVFFVGILRFAQVDAARPDLSGIYGKQFEARGIIISEPERSQSVSRFVLQVRQLDNGFARPFAVMVTGPHYPEFLLGDELILRGKIEEPENYSEFDYVSYLARQNIFAAMFFPETEKVSSGKGNRILLGLSRLKHAFEKNIEAVLPEPHAALLKGLTLGERESLPDDLVEDLKRTGTTHIVALSGYNITMIGRFFVTALMWLTLPFRISFWIASAAITLFILLTGASPSVVRAGIMGILVLVAQKEGRLYQMTNALVFAGAVMILHNPKILRFDAAFQLSFLATLGLIYLSPEIGKILDRRGKFVPAGPVSEDKPFFSWKQTLMETLAAQIMVLPLLIYLFGRISLISPLSNILVLMAVPYAMISGFITGILGFLWVPVSFLAAWTSWIFLEYEIRVIRFFSLVPLADISLGKWSVFFVSFFYLWILWKIKKAALRDSYVP